RVDRAGRPDLAAELAQLGRECIGQPLRPTPWERPADDMSEHDQREAETRARPALERQQRMGRVAGEPGASSPLGEALLRERASRRERAPQNGCESACPQPLAETKHGAWRDRKRPEKHALDFPPATDQRADQLSIRLL